MTIRKDDSDGLVERLRDPHYLTDEERARTPDRVLVLIQEVFRPERRSAADRITALEQRLAETRAVKEAEFRFVRRALDECIRRRAPLAKFAALEQQLAEAREDAASIAEKKCVHGLGNNEWDAGYDAACLDISAAIRALNANQPQEQQGS